MTWVCECGVIVENRSKFLLHKGICKSKNVNLKKCDLQEGSYQDNLKESDQSACASPDIEDNVTGAQISDLLSTTAGPRPIGLVGNLIKCGQGDVLPAIDKARSDIYISLEGESVIDNNVIINSENGEKHTSSSVEKPTRSTEYNQLISDTLCDIPQVS